MITSRNVTKQRILDCAATLFAEKGFTETTVRELAEAVGLNPATLYFHFPSKNAILEHILEEYSAENTDIFDKKNISQILQENPTTEGILACLQLSYPPDKAEYYIKVLCVLLQEQLRNPIVRKYMAEQSILQSEQDVKKVIETLKELGALREDTDPDYWIKTVSSLYYAFSARMMLGIGDNAPGFAGMSMAEMLKFTFDIMFEKCGTV